MLSDAAVVGKVFWAGAVAAMGDRDARGRHLRDARAVPQGARADRPDAHRCRASPSMPSGTCSPVMSPTGSCREPPEPTRHVAAARWIESKAPERVEDLADVLAYHYAAALELARAAGQTDAGGRPRGAGAAVPHPRRRACAWAGHRRGAFELRAGARAHATGAPRPSRGVGPLRRSGVPGGALCRGGGGSGGGDRFLPSSRRSRRHGDGDACVLRTTPRFRRSAGMDVGSRGPGAPRALAARPGSGRGAHPRVSV